MLRPVVRGRGCVSAEVVKFSSPVSFLGDLDPVEGRLMGVEVAGKVVSLPFVRGSTVGPYVLWGAARRGRAPVAIVSKKIDLMLVTACVLAGVPLFQGELEEGCINICLDSGVYERCG